MNTFDSFNYHYILFFDRSGQSQCAVFHPLTQEWAVHQLSWTVHQLSFDALNQTVKVATRPKRLLQSSPNISEHEFVGRTDQPCEICGVPDRYTIHVRKQDMFKPGMIAEYKSEYSGEWWTGSITYVDEDIVTFVFNDKSLLRYRDGKAIVIGKAHWGSIVRPANPSPSIF